MLGALECFPSVSAEPRFSLCEIADSLSPLVKKPLQTSARPKHDAADGDAPHITFSGALSTNAQALRIALSLSMLRFRCV